MISRPAIPSLVLIPGESKDDYRAIYAIAMAYAKAGLLISDEAKETNQPEFVFPAVVCSSFAIELFLKAFIAQENTEKEPDLRAGITGHPLIKLWNKISPARQALIAGMLGNSTDEPWLNATDTRVKGFVDALTNLGLQPFVRWRYVHEFEDITHMSHAALVEITDALGRAAKYAMKGKSDVNTVESSESRPLSKNPELPLICGSDALLLGRSSFLRQIPSNCDPEQILCFDGIRHSLEIMDVTYKRLRGALTNMAMHPPEANTLSDAIAYVFLDAWGFVHAVNRFERMYSRLTKKTCNVKTQIPTLRDATQEFRNVMKAADDGLGKLSWLTGVQILPEVIAMHCTLLSGTHSAPPTMDTDPILSTLDWPTDSIKLSAGKYEANLSAVREHVAHRMKHLEAQLQEPFQALAAQSQIINDAFMARPVKIKDCSDL